MTYNLYFQFDNGEANLYAISEAQVQKIAEVYKKGLTAFTINHQQYGFRSIHHIGIFENAHNHTTEQLEDWAESSNSFGLEPCMEPGQLATFGENVTSRFVEDEPFGYEKNAIAVAVERTDHYIDPSRIDELRNIKSAGFDLSKLVRLCEELNDNWKRGNFYSVGLIGRSIINHVPPVFGPYTTFDKVVANGPNSSFKKNAGHLQDSLRSIADSYTHHVTRKKESLPNAQQVDFRANLDVLLVEIIRILHT